jgi:hypothetical protein
VIAGVDCGFGTFAGRVQVDTKIVWMKLAWLAERGRLASNALMWGLRRSADHRLYPIVIMSCVFMMLMA